MMKQHSSVPICVPLSPYAVSCMFRKEHDRVAPKIL